MLSVEDVGFLGGPGMAICNDGLMKDVLRLLRCTLIRVEIPFVGCVVVKLQSGINRGTMQVGMLWCSGERYWSSCVLGRTCPKLWPQNAELLPVLVALAAGETI